MAQSSACHVSNFCFLCNRVSPKALFVMRVFSLYSNSKIVTLFVTSCSQILMIFWGHSLVWFFKAWKVSILMWKMSTSEWILYRMLSPCKMFSNLVICVDGAVEVTMWASLRVVSVVLERPGLRIKTTVHSYTCKRRLLSTKPLLP